MHCAEGRRQTFLPFTAVYCCAGRRSMRSSSDASFPSAQGCALRTMRPTMRAVVAYECSTATYQSAVCSEHHAQGGEHQARCAASRCVIERSSLAGKDGSDEEVRLPPRRSVVDRIAAGALSGSASAGHHAGAVEKQSSNGDWSAGGPRSFANVGSKLDLDAQCMCFPSHSFCPPLFHLTLLHHNIQMSAQ